MVIEKLKTHKSPIIDQIPAEMIKAVGRIIHSAIQKLINSIWNKKKLPEQWTESIILTTQQNGDKTDVVIIEGYQFY